MRHFERAVAEQLRSFLYPEEGITNGERGTVATYQQITGYRRKIADIYMDMIDAQAKSSPPINGQQPAQQYINKPDTRKHKRGKRSTQARLRHSRNNVRSLEEEIIKKKASQNSHR